MIQLNLVEKRKIFLILFFAAMLVSAPMSAQVTIGSGNPPSDVSLLHLDASKLQRGLHNARLTTTQRNGIVNDSSLPEVKVAARGLMIFNITNYCFEYWDGTRWVSLCMGDEMDPCAGFDNIKTEFPLGATIADLTVAARQAGGTGHVEWFATATGGAPLPANTPLVNNTEYFAANCLNATDRKPVKVNIIN